MDFRSTQSHSEMWAWWAARIGCKHMCTHARFPIYYLHNPLQGVCNSVCTSQMCHWRAENTVTSFNLMPRWVPVMFWQHVGTSSCFFPPSMNFIFTKTDRVSISLINAAVGCWEATNEQRHCRRYLGISVNRVVVKKKKNTKQLLPLIFGRNLLLRKTKAASRANWKKTLRQIKNRKEGRLQILSLGNKTQQLPADIEFQFGDLYLNLWSARVHWPYLSCRLPTHATNVCTHTQKYYDSKNIMRGFHVTPTLFSRWGFLLKGGGAGGWGCLVRPGVLDSDKMVASGRRWSEMGRRSAWVWNGKIAPK